MPKTIVVLPAYNAAKTLKQTVADIPEGWADEIILVDDFSNDETFQLAQELGLTTIRHQKNLGYGGNQKTCYQTALDHGADIVIMLHPDYQYDPKLIKYFVEFIRDGYFDVMLGSRIRSRKEALAGGMPRYKYIFNRLLSLLENIVTGHNLSEWHTGMRAYHRKVLEKIDFHSFSDDFVFDSQMMFAMVKNEFKIGDIPVPVRYFHEASSINLKRSIEYGLGTVWEAIKFIFKK
ncbi:MAG: glycosyl transferase family 2 [Parcubacteria group bacterium CG1_02_37_51]|uniref:Glycosyl transferase family 2 n=2 Tax=Candidatus Komeiliibacteriota TaxID=1817908 RepID=A0A2M8DR72_9BACT|nr:MAG: glycosyl transferase family 2 [Parcubacteria group bacterium CG1_02_37_51]PIY95206.1 MAG: glycosyl transferase family 2 [Candidatus Komeilibacteria bacterium CG_4_10_14_0_8_um_filter_37_78]PJC01852.1 MAG: glycosyl transferase family 2 [Candidatus Komeilibacteria bacterium CG_4_9_14_0_8_um_filter_36_9]